MPRDIRTVEISRSASEVFDRLHDYTARRLWDTLLSEARLLDGASQAALGVRSLCIGTWHTAYLAVETEYIQFVPGKVAAVRLTNTPLWLKSFAATIRHEDIETGRSRLTYIYSFDSRPWWLASVLDPILKRLFSWELQNRLHSLKWFLESEGVSDSPYLSVEDERRSGMERPT